MLLARCAVFGWIFCAAAALEAAAGDSLWEERQALDAQFARQLAELAASTETAGLSDQAERTRAWILPGHLRRLVLGNVPRTHDLAPVADEPPAVETWRGKFAALRDAQAEGLFTLARRAAAEGQPSLAYGLVMDALRENPDHEAARRLLGQRRVGNRWSTPYEIRKSAAAQVWHERFGWLPLANVARYEAGQRLLRGRWVSAEEDAAAHREINAGWQVESEHYLVVTNHSLEAGVQLAARLERLYDIWQRVFASYVFSPDQLSRTLEGKGSLKPSTDRLRVVYFRTRDEYNQALRPAQSNIDMTVGIYFTSTRTAYFFADESQDNATLYHEATHQLFAETRHTVDDPGRTNNFWIVEAAALYMESLQEHDGYVTLGGADHIRVRAARQRLVDDGFYVPLAELTGFGRERLQDDPRIAKLYSQASGLAHFLVHADQGRYREALIRYLTAVYSGRARPGTLAEVAGTPLEGLDEQYRAFIKAEPAQIGATK